MFTEATEIASSWGLVGVPLAVVSFLAWLLNEPIQSLIKAKETRLKEQELFYKHLEANSLDGPTKKALLEGVTRQQFKRAYGLDLTPNERTALLQLFEEMEPGIRWLHIRNAFPHIRFIGPKVTSVEISAWAHIVYGACFTFSMCLLGLSVLLLIVSSAAFVSKSLTSAAEILLVALVYYVAGYIFYICYVPCIHAKKIRQAISGHTNCEGTQDSTIDCS